MSGRRDLLQCAAWRGIARAIYLVAGALVGAYLFGVLAPAFGTFGADAIAYWSAAPPLYDIPHGEFLSYVYSPAFYQITAPLRLLDWVGFAWMWGAINVATAIWLGPFALAFAPTQFEIYFGNVHLLMAAAIVLGFRHPWTWAFILHTKPTAGLGLLWFVVRGEWRKLAVALGATTAIAAVSFLMAPAMWTDYITMLLQVRPQPATSPLVVPIPFLARFPLAVVMVVWGARTDREWTVPVAAMLALPELWWHGVAVMAGVFTLRGWRGFRHPLGQEPTEIGAPSRAGAGEDVARE